MRKRIAILTGALIGSAIFFPAPAFAHCPLCTIGAAAAAVGARFFGAGTASIGIFLGAFAVALGLWMSMLLRKKYIPMQGVALSVLSFATTIIPLRPLFPEYGGFQILLTGDYGSLLNRTYSIELLPFAALVGGLLMYYSGRASGVLSVLLKGKRFPYQGIVLSFVLLMIASVILEYAL